MNDLTRLRLVANGGVISGAELTTTGCDGHEVRALVRCGELVRVRAGAFVDGTVHASLDPVGRHSLAARSIVRRLHGYAVCDLSAVSVWGLPVINGHLDRIHVCQVGAGRARSAGRVVVHAPVAASDVVPHLGVLVVRPTLAVLQSARSSMVDGLIAADAAVRAGLSTRGQLLTEARTRRLGYAAHRVADLASGLSESPGESWTRLVLAGLGVAAEQQVAIRDHDGRFVARVDFLLPDLGVVVEFDGAMKYAGVDGRDALVREKRREDALRALGYRVVRLTWSDLQHPERVVAALGPATHVSA
jgi:very-short-patch-repair endonuclease